MLKVVFVTNYIVRNGPGNVILNLISNLDDARYEISLITLFEGNDTYVVKNLRNKGVRVYECVTLNRTMCILSRANISNALYNFRFIQPAAGYFPLLS